MVLHSVRSLLASLLGLLALIAATGEETPPMGLVSVEHPASNPLTEAKRLLGEKLFFDKMLSRDGSISCATCHKPEEAFAEQGVVRSKGVDGKLGRRNTPSLFNVAFAKNLFFDGRSTSLEEQAWEPILAEDEMGNVSEEKVLERLRVSEAYRGLFKRAFGNDEPSKETVAKSLACFQRTLLSGSSAYDRWNAGKPALSEAAHEGYQLFIGRAQCWQCHPLNSEASVLMTDHSFHMTGVPISEVADEPATDLGRFEVTEEPIDRLLFKTPSLRNVALTPPYMHDGSIATLKEVVEFYNVAEGAGELLPLGLGEVEVDALVAFLESFTGERVSDFSKD
ncbi:MAG: c-type cytochrome [Verrucomicrobiales bacterium]|nr:c-type cytochrome [Verrucomicrobiales bacterium]